MAKAVTAPADGKPQITNQVFRVADLKPNPRNVRRHPESQVAQIARSIETFGFVPPLVVRPNGMLIAGHGTLLALARLHAEMVDCRVVAGLSEARYDALAIALNRLPENSDWQEDLLAEVLGELREGDDVDPLATGFTPSQLDKIIKGPEAIEVREIETGPVEDEFWISVRGPLKHQAAALTELQTVMAKYPGVEVDLGTINVG